MSAERLAELIIAAQPFVVLTGAGVSTESGIPDFRSAGGIWERYDPMEYATIDAFRRDPAKVWDFYYGKYDAKSDRYDVVFDFREDKDGKFSRVKSKPPADSVVFARALVRSLDAAPAEVKTVGDLVAWLRGRSAGHAEALAEGAAFGAAVDQRTATFDVPLAGAREVAFFPPFTGG